MTKEQWKRKNLGVLPQADIHPEAVTAYWASLTPLVERIPFVPALFLPHNRHLAHWGPLVQTSAHSDLCGEPSITTSYKQNSQTVLNKHRIKISALLLYIAPTPMKTGGTNRSSESNNERAE